MRTLFGLGVVGLACQPAAALTCEQVRYYVETYGATAVLAYAKKVGATPKQIRDGRACLRQTAKQDVPRTSVVNDIVER